MQGSNMEIVRRGNDSAFGVHTCIRKILSCMKSKSIWASSTSIVLALFFCYVILSDETAVGTRRTATVLANNVGGQAEWIPSNEKTGASVAICLLGMERTFRHPYTFDNILRTMIAPFNDTVEVFAFIHPGLGYSWHGINNSDFHHSSKELVNWDVILARLRPVHFVFGELGFNPANLSLSSKCQFLDGAAQYFAMERCLRAIEMREQTRGQQFEWILRIRPDAVYQVPFPVDKLLICPDGRGSCRRKSFVAAYFSGYHSGPNDILFVAGRDAADALFTAINLYKVICLPEEFPAELCAKPLSGNRAYNSCIPRVQLALKGFPQPLELLGPGVWYPIVLVRPCARQNERNPVCSTNEWKNCCVFLD
mmetsp:Transcript_34255/g.55410  ORF Transcript_34255/g.55410 Transcript_34255/m.55410 type:complete len:366 (-) Transcript_34255:764-1861(-)